MFLTAILFFKTIKNHDSCLTNTIIYIVIKFYIIVKNFKQTAYTNNRNFNFNQLLLLLHLRIVYIVLVED